MCVVVMRVVSLQFLCFSSHIISFHSLPHRVEVSPLLGHKQFFVPQAFIALMPI